MAPTALRGRSKPAFRFFADEITSYVHRNPGLNESIYKFSNALTALTKMISVAEAIQIVKENTPTLASERVSLLEALGRVLAKPVIADTDLPPFDRSQMDGYAVRAADVKEAPVRLRIAGE